jgi:hypothetical protein
MILQHIIEAYLRAVGFSTYTWRPEGQQPTVLWGHPSLGQGRSFHDALAWALGCEYEGRDLRSEAGAVIA